MARSCCCHFNKIIKGPGTSLQSQSESEHVSNVCLTAYYNHRHNIMRIFDVLPNFSFTTSETNRDY